MPDCSTSAIDTRQQLELSSLATIPGLPVPVARLLARRTALLAGDAAARGPAELAELRGARPALHVCQRLLGSTELTPAMLPVLDAAWQLAAPVEYLLVAGGDERLAIDDATGLNRYGCAPLPRPGVIAFASCTASSISPFAYLQAERCRRQMLRCAVSPGGSATDAVGQAAQSVCDALLARWSLADIASVILAASGTDAALLLTGLLCGGEAATTIVLSPAETGSGVPEAVRGRHFAGVSADGRPVTAGHAVDGFAPIRLLSVPVREADGRGLSLEAIEAACAAAVEAACGSGGRVVLHAIDGSKTGLSAPRLPALSALQARHPQLVIVIDACQARLPPARLRRYLAHGWPVMLTGSKFFGGPGFSGALLVPHGLALAPAPAGLAGYLIAPGGGLPDAGIGHANAGLVLRWHAALAEMRRFDEQSGPAFGHTLDRLGATTRRLIAATPGLVAIDDWAEAPVSEETDWTSRRTVFTFALRESGRLTTMERLRRIHHLLNRDLTSLVPAADPALAATLCQIGQPVLLGSRDGQPFGGLRIAFGASHADPAVDHEAQLAIVFGKLRLILEGKKDLLF